MRELDKKFYKIGDVSEILGIPESTLRYWETQFTIIKPKRNKKNIRYYTPNDIEIISKVYYLVKEKGRNSSWASSERLMKFSLTSRQPGKPLLANPFHRYLIRRSPP